MHEGGVAPERVLIMGVSGCGKSTIGTLLGQRTGSRFLDADDLHPAENVAKMRRGVPLTDADRRGWLDLVASWIGERARAGQPGVIGCSALKRSYRDALRQADPNLRLAYLKGDRQTLTERLTHRHGHFFPHQLLDTQLGELEEPTPDEHAIIVPIGQLSPEQAVDTIATDLGRGSIATQTERVARLTDLDHGPLSYGCLMAQRGVVFTNVFNFRDLGGYRSADGTSVRWHRLFRSDDLSRLTDDDAQRFAELGIRTVVDLRRPDELQNIGRIPPLPGFSYHHAHLVHPLWPEETFIDTAHRAAYVRKRYLEILDAGRVGVGQTLRLIADAHAAPLVFHCMAGKDRTGIISALTLSLLGVADEDIADDYQLSELAEQATWGYLAREKPELAKQRWKHITVSPRDGMLGMLADLRDRHGSVAAYADSIGVSADHIAAMRAHLLQPSSPAQE